MRMRLLCIAGSLERLFCLIFQRTDDEILSTSNTNEVEIQEPTSGGDTSGDLVENEIPASGPYEVQTQVPTHDQKIRSHLAKIIIWSLVIFYGAAIPSFVFGLIDTEKFTALIASFSGLQALAAAAVGFYYGSNKTST